MNIHEFQAKQLLARYTIPVPRGRRADTVAEAVAIANELAAPITVVKAQIHAGGRGKAGGVKLAKSRDQVEPLAREILGKTLVTPQTGPQGKVVKKLLIEEGVSIGHEFYLSLVVDRASASIAVIASREGGMEIEEVAATHPDKIVKVFIDPTVGYQPFHGRRVAFALGLPKDVVNAFVKLLGSLYTMFTAQDASLVEINPLVLTTDQRLIALDAKMNFDDNGLFRHEDVRAFRDLDEEEPLEIRASEHNLNYVKLDGTIGCMVNGAGLAMATMDVVKLAGGSPANFLDVGGGATKETVKEAFGILMADPNVRGVFVNIFGGIVRCERIAGGIIDATREVHLSVPLVVRLDGTNAEEGKKMLASSGLNLEVANTMWEGAQRIVALSGKGPA
ncbi:MAG: succinate--CoA ligase subunit beta [Nitrospirae bacterium RIFCSPHIGHO2_01_FULL_66_17]|nr:MAG: succinate--CoA ligase subunit beta [Nitrospirae bacterium RIFCSPHIGHO2_01_FULL_66_17]